MRGKHGQIMSSSLRIRIIIFFNFRYVFFMKVCEQASSSKRKKFGKR